MNDQQTEPKKGLWSSLDTATKLVGVLAAIAGVASTASGILAAKASRDLQQLSSEVSKLQNERTYASDILSRFDSIVTASTTDEVRIDRLSGLLTLTVLISDDQEDLRKRLGGMIEGQIARSTAAVKARTGDNPGAAQQIAQYQVLQRQAARVSNPARWANYDFDVFYCTGGPQAAGLKAMADRVVAVRAQDPSANGRWRARPLAPGRVAAEESANRGFSIRYDYADEEPFARELERVLNEAKVAGSRKFQAVGAKVASTPWYLSVFICPA